MFFQDILHLNTVNVLLFSAYMTDMHRQHLPFRPGCRVQPGRLKFL